MASLVDRGLLKAVLMLIYYAVLWLEYSVAFIAFVLLLMTALLTYLSLFGPDMPFLRMIPGIPSSIHITEQDFPWMFMATTIAFTILGHLARLLLRALRIELKVSIEKRLIGFLASVTLCYAIIVINFTFIEETADPLGLLMVMGFFYALTATMGMASLLLSWFIGRAHDAVHGKLQEL